jgi:ElaB/YqjD/DUF883 family membrane-anchored ribosome-binding protein
MSEASVNTLVEQLRQVVRDAEVFLEASAHESDAQAASVRDRVSASVTEARDALERLQADLGSRAKAAAADADRYVHDNVWTSIGVAGAVGVLLGLLLGRR